MEVVWPFCGIPGEQSYRQRLLHRLRHNSFSYYDVAVSVSVSSSGPRCGRWNRCYLFLFFRPNGVHASANGGCDIVCWQCLFKPCPFRTFDHREFFSSGGARRPLSSSAGSRVLHLVLAVSALCSQAPHRSGSRDISGATAPVMMDSVRGTTGSNMGPVTLLRAGKSGWFSRVSSQALRGPAQAICWRRAS